jgi:hypothetical protein
VSNIVVTSENEKLLQEAMAGTPDAPRIDADLRRAYREADGPVRAGVVGPPAQTNSAVAPLALLFEKNPEPPPLCHAQSISTKVRSDATEVRIESTYADSAKAKLAAGQMNDGMKRALAMAVAGGERDGRGVYFLRVIFDTFRAEASGVRVLVTFRIPHSELKRLKLLN